MQKDSSRFCRPEAVATYSFIMVLMYAIVPVLGASFGAWLAYENFWRWIFHVNEPISLFLAGYFWLFFRQDRPSTSPSHSFDYSQDIFSSRSASAPLVTAATLSQQLDWYRSPTLVTLTAIGVPSFLSLFCGNSTLLSHSWSSNSSGAPSSLILCSISPSSFQSILA